MGEYVEALLILHQMENTVEGASPTDRAKMADEAVKMARELKESNPELSERFTQIAAKARQLGTKWIPPLPPGTDKRFAGG